jgi:hypothetical protein
MTYDDYDGPVFRAGIHAWRAEFRSSDAAGRPVDAAAETPTQRTERILALQDRRAAQGPREAPAADAESVWSEWLRDPQHRMSVIGKEWATRCPVECETEPLPGQAPVPGGLLERMARTRRGRGSQF